MTRSAFAAGLLVAMALPALAAEKPFEFPPVEPDKPASAGAAGPDLAFGAYQRGFYLTAFAEATKRIQASQDPVAMTLLGELYTQGLGVERDLTKAAQWYSEAARRGNKDAIFALAMAKLAGPDKTIKNPAERGLAKDEAGAVLLLNRAAQMGVPAASYNLGLIALRPVNGPPDFATAVKRFTEAAKGGNADAFYALGVLTRDGKGVAADPTRAAEFFASAARAGNVDAMLEYGIMLFNGVGVSRDMETGVEWLRKAAEAGSAIAANRLARIYISGVGVSPNPEAKEPDPAVSAGLWYLVSKSAGLDDKMLDDFFKALPPDLIKQAVDLARRRGVNITAAP